MLQDYWLEDIVEVPAAEQQVQQGGILVDELDGHAHNQSQVTVAQLAETVASLGQLPDASLLLGEHFACVFLVALELGEQDVGLLLLEVVLVAHLKQLLVGLLERQIQVDEVLHEVA